MRMAIPNQQLAKGCVGRREPSSRESDAPGMTLFHIVLSFGAGIHTLEWLSARRTLEDATETLWTSLEKAAVC